MFGQDVGSKRQETHWVAVTGRCMFKNATSKNKNKCLLVLLQKSVSRVAKGQEVLSIMNMGEVGS